MPVPLGANARHMHDIARWALRAVVLTALLTLWWPSIEGWTALGAAASAAGLLWLCWRALTGETEVPGHVLHLGLAGVCAVACYHVIRWEGVTYSPGARPLLGQFAASLITHLSLLALLVMLTQDLLARRPPQGPAMTVFGAAALGGAFIGLLFGDRAEGRLMLAMMGWTGLAILCCPLWRRRAEDVAEGPGRRRRLARCARVGLAVVGASVLAVSSPPSVTVTTAAAAVTLLTAALCLPGRRAGFALAAFIAAISCGAQAWALGWIRQPRWPRNTVDWVGRGGEALIDTAPWTNDVVLLLGAVGWAGAVWLIAVLLSCLIAAMWRVRRIPRDNQPGALVASLAAVLAAVTWLSPGGLFNPAINVTFVVVWAAWPAVSGRHPTRRSGWWVLAALVAISLVLGLVRRVGLLYWAVDAHGHGGWLLHAFTGLLVTAVLLWLLSRRKGGPFLAMGLSLAAAVAGELAQWLLVAARHAQLRDVLDHMTGAAVALAIYLLCRASRWSESPDVVDHRQHTDADC